MKRLASILIATVAILLVPASFAGAEYGLEEFEVSFTDSSGEPVTQAGSHPYEMTTSVRFDSIPTGEGGAITEEAARDFILTLPAGFVGNPTAVPRCSTADFLDEVCPVAAALGISKIEIASKTGGAPVNAPVYNLAPPPGRAAKLGWSVLGVPVTVELGVKESPPYNVVGGPTNIPQVIAVLSAEITIWGNPADSAHDPLRGGCLQTDGSSSGKCQANVPDRPFLTLPRSCEGSLKTDFMTRSWQSPETWLEGFALNEDSAGNPVSQGGCGSLDFGPEASATPTTEQAESSSGLEIGFDVSDEGLSNPDGIAAADIAATRLAFPVGMTLNPSAAEGLGVCTFAQFEAEHLASKGCPDASKLGTLEVDTPVLENHTLRGAFYLAQQDDPTTTAKGAENPFDSLFAAYLIVRDTELGVFAKLPAKIETDPATGQVVSTVDDMPPFPLERVRVDLRSGPRAPLITPPACGTHATEVELTPSSGASPLIKNSTFEIDSGPNGGPCPSGGTQPFSPGFEAGSENSAAGRFTPFSMRLTRADGDQDLTKFSATLPPGLTGKLAGLSRCPDAAIAGAKAKRGRDEQASPSCPASSKIGNVLAGAGVGTALTYVPGSLYLAGPYNGAPLSVAAIVPAVAGPFDVGTVVTRVALDLNPTTAEVEVDGSRSDPIPHILAGIPLKVRDIRVMTDRPSFTLNPTSCDEYATRAQIFGSGGDVFSPADDSPLARSTRFQASSCASLGFKPKLAFKLNGGTKRGGHPALVSTYVPRAGDANLEGLVVRLPRSAFLDQGHIRTICTRVQFAVDACPAGAQYGTIEATTPLLDEPLKGPVWLRSSDHNLPDLVFDLQGLVDVEVSTRIDSVRGGIRASIEGAPDAPITKVVLRMQGGKKGLIVNSRSLCSKASKAGVRFSGHNGKTSSAKPVLNADCGGKGKRKRRSGR